jgi:hypothetical protein
MKKESSVEDAISAVRLHLKASEPVQSATSVKKQLLRI